MFQDFSIIFLYIYILEVFIFEIHSIFPVSEQLQCFQSTVRGAQVGLVLFFIFFIFSTVAGPLDEWRPLFSPRFCGTAVVFVAFAVWHCWRNDLLKFAKWMTDKRTHTHTHTHAQTQSQTNRTEPNDPLQIQIQNQNQNREPPCGDHSIVAWYASVSMK